MRDDDLDLTGKLMREYKDEQLLKIMQYATSFCNGDQSGMENYPGVC